jgi:hypothetical protein
MSRASLRATIGAEFGGLPARHAEKTIAASNTMGVTDVANPVVAGDEVSGGRYRCLRCEAEVDVAGYLSYCLSCGNDEYEVVSAEDSAAATTRRDS